MKIVLFSRPEVGQKPEELLQLFKSIEKAGLECVFHSDFAREAEKALGASVGEGRIFSSAQPGDIAVSYGGDGTFLDCVRELGMQGIPVLGINSGRLGFLANVPKEEMAAAFEDLKRGDYEKERRTLIRAEGDFPAMPSYPYAFNEFTVQRGSTSMISVNAYIDGEMVATYWSDGVILSTPAGSTAYSLSAGGPVVALGCDCFVLSPIAPHNLTMRPIVIPDTSEVTFTVNSRDSNPYVTLDNNNYEVPNGATIKLSKAEKNIFLVKLQNISFYDTLRNKMLWGIDRRDESK